MIYPVALKNDSYRGKEISEFRYGRDDFRQIADVLLAETGIYLSDEKIPLVYSRLVKRLSGLGMDSFSDYIELIASDAGEFERDRMLYALTTNVTRFFREPHHFGILKDKILPPLMAYARKGGKVRIWSAACSSGEEPYSIAMSVLSTYPDASSLDVKILASDIDGEILEKAYSGIYQFDELEDVSAAQKCKHFKKVESTKGAWEVRDDLRQLVDFRQVNLIKPWPIECKFDVIFCRNVVIYFQDKTQQELWSRFHRAMAINSWLIIGHSERVTGPAMSAFHCEGSTAYRRMQSDKKLFQ